MYPLKGRRVRAATFGGKIHRKQISGGVPHINAEPLTRNSLSLIVPLWVGLVRCSILTHAQGPIVSPEPDITEYHLSPDDRFMVCVYGMGGGTLRAILFASCIFLP